MRHLGWVLAMVSMLGAACSSGGGGDSTTPDGSGTTDTASDQGGNDPGNTPDAPTRSPSCSAYDDGVYGAKVPWEGFSHGGKSYTCNRCRGGDELIQGTWRIVDPDSEEPFPVDPDVYVETITIDGNTWTQRSAGPDLGAYVDATISGWYFCASKPELASENKVFVTTAVAPSGAFGYDPGVVWSAETLMDGASRLALGFYDGVDDEWIGYNFYCRVGSTAECTDPFEEP